MRVGNVLIGVERCRSEGWWILGIPPLGFGCSRHRVYLWLNAPFFRAYDVTLWRRV